MSDTRILPVFFVKRPRLVFHIKEGTCPECSKKFDSYAIHVETRAADDQEVKLVIWYAHGTTAACSSRQIRYFV